MLAVAQRAIDNEQHEIGIGDPKFASVQLPIGIGDSLYTLIVHGQAFGLAGGDTFDFATHGFANGVPATNALKAMPSKDHARSWSRTKLHSPSSAV